MHTYPIRLSEELYEKLGARARTENRTIASLLREAADIAAGNLTVNAQLSAIREEIAKIGCGSIANRAIIMSAIETLSRGDVNLEDFEREIAVYEIMLRGVRYHGIETVDELRKFVRKALDEENKKQMSNQNTSPVKSNSGDRAGAKLEGQKNQGGEEKKEKQTT